jgi:hypothetical protein
MLEQIKSHLPDFIKNFLENEGHMPENQNPSPAPAPADATPPNADAELAKRSPAHLPEQLAKLDPSLAAFIEKTVADKQNAMAAAEAAKAEAKAAEAKAAQLSAEKEAATKKQLEEQGNYKALYEKAEDDKRQLLQAFQERTVKEVVARELVKQGAVDEDLTDLVLSRHKETIRYQDGQVLGVNDAVALFKTQKPAFFKAPEPAAPAPSSTGLPVTSPQPGTPSAFDARLQPRTPEGKAAVDAEWEKAIRQLRERR